MPRHPHPATVILCLSLGATAALPQDLERGLEIRRLRGDLSSRSQRSLPAPPSTTSLGAAGIDTSLLGGIPDGKASDETLSLSLVDALARGLRQNLGLLLRQQAVQEEGARLKLASSSLKPALWSEVVQRSQQFNFEASPFSRFRPPGVDASGVVDFDTFEARLFLSAPLLDLPAWHNRRAARAELVAAGQSLQETRNLVALLVGNLYLRSLTSQARLRAVEAQESTSESLFELAQGQYQSGLVSSVDKLRAENQLERDRQRRIVAKNQHAKAKLRLARAIGLPLGQPFHLTDTVGYVPVVGVTLEAALERAHAQRPDLRQARAKLEAATSARRAAKQRRLPRLELEADYGALGPTAERARGTFNAIARLRIPLFEGGLIRAEVLEKDSVVQKLRLALTDLEAKVYYEVSEALLDLDASDQGVQVAGRAVEIAERQLTQSRDRFASGVTSNLEVVEAQESLAAGHQALIDAKLFYRLAKGSLARATGVDDQTIVAALAAEARAAEEPPKGQSRGVDPL